MTKPRPLRKVVPAVTGEGIKLDRAERARRAPPLTRTTLVAMLLTTVLVVTACRDAPATPTTNTSRPSATVEPRSAEGLRTTGWGPELPSGGAWLGAWVKPSWQTPNGRVEALSAFAVASGGRLAVAHMFHDWTDDFPSATEYAFRDSGMLPMISWSGTDTRSITDGVYDRLIRQRATAIRQFGTPVLLRWRWEMDRPNLRQSVRSPADYVAAWKRIRGIFSELGVTNAGFVWCPHVRGFVEPERNAAAYYPGDDQVDWLCADVYPGPDFDGFSSQLDAFMAFARQRPRPVLVGEFGVTTLDGTGRRPRWLREAHAYLKRHPQIRAAVYFAEKQNTKSTYDSTFADDPDGLAAFRELAGDPYFQAPVPPVRR